MNFTGDPARIRWCEFTEDTCSYCNAALPEDGCPLRLFQQGGRIGAAFCDRCAADFFGVQCFGDEE
jgi:hypothetical protein